MRPKSWLHVRIPSLLLATTALAAAPAAGLDGGLDTEGFYPPSGHIGMVGAGLVADGGLAAPDGMAIALFHKPDAEVDWRTVPPDFTLPTQCPFTLSLATDAEYHDALFDREGRLVLVGTATFPVFGKLIFATRYLYPACDLDESFSDDGYFSFDLPEDVTGLRIRTQIVHILGIPVERLILAGDRRYPSGGPGGNDFDDTLILRLRGDGELDTTFDGDGWASLDFQGETQLLADFVVDHQGRIVFGANVDSFTANADFVVGRLTPSGQPDPAFDGDGWRRMIFAAGAEDYLGAMEVASNNDVFLAGVADLGAPRHIGVIRMSASGTLGRQIETAGSLSYVTSSVLQGDRKLVLAGWSNGLNGDFDIFALRVLVPPGAAPAVDPTFGNGADADPLTYLELEIVDNGSDAAQAIDLAGGKPVLFGEMDFGDPQGMFIARLWNGYIFVDGFESGDTSAW